MSDCPLVERVTLLLEQCMQSAEVNLPVELISGHYPSPTLLIDGLDVATGEPLEGQPRCRLDLPTREQILLALTGLR
jgi:hypothetical protein